jgi:hypothetical protein
VNVSVPEAFATPGWKAQQDAQAPSASARAGVRVAGAVPSRFSYSRASVRCGVSVSVPVQFTTTCPAKRCRPAESLAVNPYSVGFDFSAAPSSIRDASSRSRLKQEHKTTSLDSELRIRLLRKRHPHSPQVHRIVASRRSVGALLAD